MITQAKKYEIFKDKRVVPILFFENYAISREGKLYYLDLETGKDTDISHIIFDYTKKGVPIYRLLDLKDNSKFLEIRLDKLVLNTFIGDLEGKIIHKDYDPMNCSLDNLMYELNITKVDNSDSLWINNKEFKKIYESDLYTSNDGAVYHKMYNRLLRKTFDRSFYEIWRICNKTIKCHRLVYSIWVGEIPEGMTINHKDGNKRNNHYTNLEIMTNRENTRHAHNNGLLPGSRFTEEQIHTICQLLERNYSNKKIIQHFKITTKKEKKKMMQTLKQIVGKKKIWEDISSQYNIANYDVNTHKLSTKLSSEDVVEICKLLAKKHPISDIADKYDVSKSSITNILLGKVWRPISAQFSLEEYYDTKITDNMVHEICKLIDKKCSTKYISEKLGISQGIISSIKNGFGHYNISRNYNFLKYCNDNIDLTKLLESILTDENIHTMCQMMADNISCKEIIKYFNITNNLVIKKMVIILRDLRNKKIYTNISANYNFDNYDNVYHSKTSKLSLENVHEICKRLEKGISAKDLSIIYDVDYMTIWDILKRRTWKDVSSSYNF